MLTSEGNFKVEIGNLEKIDFKVKGFKTFVEKFLVYQDPQKYTKISVKYDNQIVTTLNPRYGENDSLLNLSKKEFDKMQGLKIIKNNLKTETQKKNNETAKTKTI